MSSVELYRKRAVECYSLAEEFSDERQRVIMRQLALCWLHLFEQANEKTRREDVATQDRCAASAAAPIRDG